MKTVPILLFVVLSLSFIVIAPISIGSSYALKDERWQIYYSDVRKCKKQRYRSYSIHIS